MTFRRQLDNPSAFDSSEVGVLMHELAAELWPLRVGVASDSRPPCTPRSDQEIKMLCELGEPSIIEGFLSRVAELYREAMNGGFL